MSESTQKCPICEKPYVVYAYYSGDQSACPRCRAEARRREGVYGPSQRMRSRMQDDADMLDDANEPWGGGGE